MSMNIRILVRFTLLTLLGPALMTPLLVSVFALVAHIEHYSMSEIPWTFVLICNALVTLAFGGLAAEDLTEQRIKREHMRQLSNTTEKERRRNISALKQNDLWDYEHKAAVFPASRALR